MKKTVIKQRLLLFILAAIAAIPAANAQMERGTFTISSTFWGTGSGMFINIAPETDKQYAYTQVSLGASGAYYIVRNFALKAGLYANTSKSGKSDPVTTTNVALGVKYHFVRGFYGELAYLNVKSGKSDAVTYGRLELGYDIFLNDIFYLEPAGYIRAGLNDSSSRFGISFGFGLAF
ncbi:MAG: hypothetical protein LBJ72_13010 [Dysgonamonadaceae bacterium]|jgi:hypothetical protein|nr:hypothetical protein [Dysgonamonadaceae bacterium]